MELDWTIVLLLLVVLACPAGMWLMMRRHRDQGSRPESPSGGDGGPIAPDA